VNCFSAGDEQKLRPVQNALWLIIIMIENDTKNGIAINHILRQLLNSKQAAAAQTAAETHFYT